MLALCAGCCWSCCCVLILLLCWCCAGCKEGSYSYPDAYAAVLALSILSCCLASSFGCDLLVATMFCCFAHECWCSLEYLLVCWWFISVADTSLVELLWLILDVASSYLDVTDWSCSYLLVLLVWYSFIIKHEIPAVWILLLDTWYSLFGFCCFLIGIWLCCLLSEFCWLLLN